jgi:uncharacterized protein (DUF488 family)
MDTSDRQRQTGNAEAPGPRLYTVGHSNHDLPTFLALLAGAAVTAVADVRSSPHSRRFPHFGRPALEAALAKEGIAYVFLGDLIGGRPADLALYDSDGRADYERIRGTEAFRRGLDRLAEGMARFTIALLCSEEDPLDCHRGLMIAPALAERGIVPIHLRKDGRAEGTGEVERRLLEVTGLRKEYDDPADLFTPPEERRRAVLAEAYRIQAGRTAYRRPAGG